MRFYITTIILLTISLSSAQPYGLEQLEAHFLENNYLLLASRFNIDATEAEMVQEKVWSNPTLSISEVNLWTNAGAETFSPLFGRYGKTQQISVELEQLIETAGKRKKRVAIKRSEHRLAVYEFEELIRELKKELRQTFHYLSSSYLKRHQLADMVQLFEQMKQQYNRQADRENVSRADYHRVYNELTGLRRDLIELDADIDEYLSEMRVLTHITDLEIDAIEIDETFAIRTFLMPNDISAMLDEQNVAMKRQSETVEKAQRKLALEQANRKPDLNIQLGYDRGGNIMQDFIGLGVSMDLPVFNTNQGNIQRAKHQIDQEKAKYAALQLELEQTVQRHKNQLLTYENALSGWEKTEVQKKMLDNYHKHLQEKQVTLTEFIDYVQSYRAAHQSFLEIWENYNLTFEELQYLVGKDF